MLRMNPASAKNKRLSNLKYPFCRSIRHIVSKLCSMCRGYHVAILRLMQ
jgi:hypothetical protein